MIDRRKFLKTSVAAAVAASVPGQLWIREAFGSTLQLGLSDPALQDKFVNPVPNALNPAFIYPSKQNSYKIQVAQSVQQTGLRDFSQPGNPLTSTTIWGYGDGKRGPFSYYWPGRTFEVQSGKPVDVTWENKLGNLPMPVTSFGRPVVDTSPVSYTHLTLPTTPY